MTRITRMATALFTASNHTSRFGALGDSIADGKLYAFSLINISKLSLSARELYLMPLCCMLATEHVYIHGVS